MAKQKSIAKGALVIALFLGVPGIQCNHANCEQLRDELFAEKSVWQSCETDADCILVGGNQADCTGILACNFAVHKKHRGNAERRVASLPEDTVDCVECASPNCVRGDISVCERGSGQCVVVTSLIEASGGASGTFSGGTQASGGVSGANGAAAGGGGI